MSIYRLIAAGLGVGVVGAGVYAAAPAKEPAPVASYWMDVATQSGMGAGMMGGGRPDPSQIMAMMNGRGGAVHTLDLRLASKDKNRRAAGRSSDPAGPPDGPQPAAADAGSRGSAAVEAGNADAMAAAQRADADLLGLRRACQRRASRR